MIGSSIHSKQLSPPLTKQRPESQDKTHFREDSDGAWSIQLRRDAGGWCLQC